jgi:bacteriocin-like protein
MTSAIKTTTSKQARQPTRELTTDELARVSGGTPSEYQKETVTLEYGSIAWKYTQQK